MLGGTRADCYITKGAHLYECLKTSNTISELIFIFEFHLAILSSARVCFLHSLGMVGVYVYASKILTIITCAPLPEACDEKLRSIPRSKMLK